MSIVIIGGNFAAIAAARNTFDQIIAAGKKDDYEVTVISASEKVWCNTTAPRLLVEPEHFEKTVRPVKDFLKESSKGVKFNFIHATAEKSDFDAKTVTVKGSNGSQTVKYDYLVVATGTKSLSSAFKLNGSFEESHSSVKELNKQIIASQRIAIVGGGPTGVETAGEIAYSYPKKEVVLYTGSSGPLDFMGTKKSNTASKMLTDLKVKVVNNKRSTSVVTAENGKTTLTFGDEGSEVFDLYIPAISGKPNTSFIDSKYLDKGGYLDVDSHFRVKGHPEVIGFGDVLSIAKKTVVDIKFYQTKVFVATIKHDLFNKGSLVSYATGSLTIGVPISRNGGVGLIFGWSMPSFLVKVSKGKDFMIPKAIDAYK
ncbi:apoptosis-inducing factor 1 [[Candida] anglica]|uniref:Apoptosis-inducing factor 1 n=1 Tax=[Candida] anglica TaxID=148631 RepID=A0ABP0E9N3_9ASCO